MEYENVRVFELIQSVPWRESGRIRLFWMRYADGARDELAVSLIKRMGSEMVVPLILRTAGFSNANAVLSDVMDLFERNRCFLEGLDKEGLDRLTVLVLAKEDFRLVNVSSPITLPDWFPVASATHTYFSISDLGLTAEVKPLNCPEARIDGVSELLFGLEKKLVEKLREIYAIDPGRVNKFVDALMGGSGGAGDGESNLRIFENHITSIGDARAYRPNAADKSKFLAARILKLVLASSPKQLALAAEKIAAVFCNSGNLEIKPTFFAVMWRPANKTPIATTNWLAILLAFFQAYQLMNANAHAGEFPTYSVTLQHATSINLRRFIVEASDFVQSLD